MHTYNFYSIYHPQALVPIYSEAIYNEVIYSEAIYSEAIYRAQARSTAL